MWDPFKKEKNNRLLNATLFKPIPQQIWQLFGEVGWQTFVVWGHSAIDDKIQYLTMNYNYAITYENLSQ